MKTAVDESGRVFEWREGRWQPRDETTAAEAVAIGAGEAFTNLGRGLADIAASSVDQISPQAAQFREDLAKTAAEERELFGELQERRPFSTLFGQALPYIVSAPIAGNTIGTQALTEAALGFLNYGDFEERAERGAIGFAGGVIGGTVADRVRAAIQSSSRQARERGAGVGAERVEDSVIGTGSQSQTRTILQNAGQPVAGRGIDNENERQALRDAVNLGIRVEPGMVTGNRASRQIVASMNANPLLSDVVQREITEPNQILYTKLATRALGDETDAITPTWVERTYNRISDEYDRIAQKYPTLPGGRPLTQALESLKGNYTRSARTTGPEDPEIKRLEKVINIFAEGERIKVDEFLEQRSVYRDIQRDAARNGESNVAAIASEVVDVLDRHLMDNIQDSDAKRFFDNVQAFRLLKAIDRPATVGGDLRLRPGAIGRQLRKDFRAEFWQNDRFGTLAKNPDFERFFRATRVFNTFPEIAGDSGTATRSAIQQILGNKLGATATIAARPLAGAIIRRAQPRLDELQ